MFLEDYGEVFYIKVGTWHWHASSPIKVETYSKSEPYRASNKEELLEVLINCECFNDPKSVVDIVHYYHGIKLNTPTAYYGNQELRSLFRFRHIIWPIANAIGKVEYWLELKIQKIEGLMDKLEKMHEKSNRRSK